MGPRDETEVGLRARGLRSAQRVAAFHPKQTLGTLEAAVIMCADRPSDRRT